MAAQEAGRLAEPLLGREKKASAGGCKTLSTQNASGWLQADAAADLCTLGTEVGGYVSIRFEGPKWVVSSIYNIKRYFIIF